MKRGIFIVLIIAIGVAVYAAEKKPENAPVSNLPQATSTPAVPDAVVEKDAAISFTPANPIQGEPVLVRVENLSGTSTVRSIAFQNKSLGVFDDSALLGLDLRQTTGTYPVIATLSDGTTVRKNLVVGKRPTVEAPLGIPDSLGGNTPEAEKELLNTLAQEGALINSIPTSPNKLWSGDFRLPINPPITITDTYGYSRLTGASTIAHKGTDYRAAVGTPVYAMNSGKVAFKRFLRNYGNVVAIDHGLGLLTIYMHLSEVLVNEGQTVEKGALIAKSGDTGYVLGPHLHLTVRINQISIDPQKFMILMGES
jgi:murein DD-endopeptidase MepM/ murein hydrolase activator NlpD